MANTPRHIDQLFIQVNGSYIPQDVMAHLDEAVIEDDLAQPAMFALRFNDPRLELVDGELFKLGSEVRLGATDIAGSAKPILIGEITALEPSLDQHDVALIVRGYDRSHRLLRGTYTRTFLKRTDEDIVGEIAREAGLKADIEPVGAQHDYVIQDNLTNLAFLRERAARIGYSVTVEGTTLRFRSAERTPPAAPSLQWGGTLLSFRARLTAAAQPNEVEVRGWDPLTKQAIVGRAAQPQHTPTVNEHQSAGQVAQRAFGTPAAIVVGTRPVDNQGEAERLAQAILDQVSGSYLSAEGRCRGEPALRAGTSVEIKNLGTRLAGTYFVTATRHEYRPKDGYTTTFYVTGRRPNGLLAALEPSQQPKAGAAVAVGVVTNVQDPAKLGRVKLSFPWLDERQESNWARLALAGAGAGRGIFSSIAVNDEVLVAFEHGDINRPYVIGCLWNGKDKPPPEAVQEGRQIILLKTGAGRTVSLDDHGRTLSIVAGDHAITLDEAADSVSLAAGEHTITVDRRGQKISIASSGEVEISGAGGALRIGRQGVELTSNTLLDVKANAVLNIRGALIKLNS